jgi:hypothetical protein
MRIAAETQSTVMIRDGIAQLRSARAMRGTDKLGTGAA